MVAVDAVGESILAWLREWAKIDVDAITWNHNNNDNDDDNNDGDNSNNDSNSSESLETATRSRTKGTLSLISFFFRHLFNS